ncbi:voltage-gated purine nucleotide uniporter SLC17A9-like isoform X1 [Glandiceps talaboti]
MDRIAVDDDESSEGCPEEGLLLGDVNEKGVSVQADFTFWTRKEEMIWGAAIFILTALTVGCRNILPVSAVIMSNQFDWDKSETGLVLSSFYWGYPTTQVLSGYLSDRFGGDQVATIAAIGWGIQTAIFPFFVYTFDDKPSQLAFLAVIRVIFGMTEAFHFPTIASITVMKVQEKRRNLFYTTIATGASLGIITSGSICSYLLAKYGWEINFYLFGVLSILWVCFVRIVLMRKRCIQRCTTRKGRSQGEITTKETWKILIRHRAFWAMIIINFCGGYSGHLLFNWLPTFFTEKFPHEKGWVFNVVPWLVAAPPCMLSGYIADRMISSGISKTTTRKFIQTLASLSYTTTLMFVGHMTCYATTLTAITYAFSMDNIGTAGAYANTQDLAPTHAGAVYGVMNSISAIPGFLGVYISGHLMDYFNSWSIVFSITGSLTFTGWIIFMIFGTGERIV